MFKFDSFKCDKIYLSEIPMRLLALLSTILMGLFFVALLYLLSLQPPYFDDLWYAFQIQQTGGLLNFIEYCYFDWTGRFLQILLLWLGLHSDVSREYFQLCSGFALVGIMILGAALPLGRIPRIFGEDRLYFLVVALAVWFGTPTIDQVVFWTTGATAYLYPSLVLLLFLIPYAWYFLNDNASTTNKSWSVMWCVPFFILGAATGSSHEQVIFQVGFLLFCWLTEFYRQRKLSSIPRQLWWGIVGFVLGSVATLTAPGNYSRSSFERALVPKMGKLFPIISEYLLESVFNIGLSVGLLLMLCWCYVIVSSPVAHSKQHSNKLILALVLLCAATVGILPIWMTNYFHTERTAFPLILFVIVACASLLAYCRATRVTLNSPRFGSTLTVLIPLCLLYDVRNGLHMSHDLNHAIAVREQVISNQIRAGRRDLSVPPLPRSNSRLVLVYDEVALYNPAEKFRTYAQKFVFRGADSITVESDRLIDVPVQAKAR